MRDAVDEAISCGALEEMTPDHDHTADCYAHGCRWLTRWRHDLEDLVREYRSADDGSDVRDAWRDLRTHIDRLPTILSDAELRAGVAIQLSEIDRLRQLLRDESDRVSNLRDGLRSLAAVARRYLPDYDEHPEIQRADDLLWLSNPRGVAEAEVE